MFSKLENLQHEGPIPALRYYEPQHMDAKKKKACEDWHAEEVLKGEDWNFKKELLSYCESDVKLLKEGCLKFAEDTIEMLGLIHFCNVSPLHPHVNTSGVIFRWNPALLRWNLLTAGVD